MLGFFAAMAETERENIRESTLEGWRPQSARVNTVAGPSVITDDMLHTVLRRKALGKSLEQIQPSLIISTGKRKGQNPFVASIYRALAEHEKTQAYPEAVETAHADFAWARPCHRYPSSCAGDAMLNRSVEGMITAFRRARTAGGQGRPRRGRIWRCGARRARLRGPRRTGRPPDGYGRSRHAASWTPSGAGPTTPSRRLPPLSPRRGARRRGGGARGDHRRCDVGDAL
jgi:hypothetical protein